MIKVDVGDEPPVILTIYAVCHLHLVLATDLVKHYLLVADAILVQQLLSLGTVWTVACAEDSGLLLLYDLGETS